jgi:hypothetical protein
VKEERKNRRIIMAEGTGRAKEKGRRNRRREGKKGGG